MYKSELWDRAGASNRNRSCALDGARRVIDGLVRDVAVAGVGAVVTSAAPRDAEPLGDQFIAFFHAGTFDAAQDVNVASREYLSKAPSVHPAGNREPFLNRSAHARACRRANSEASGRSGGAV